MATLREVLQDAQRRGVAVGHFNFSDLTALQAVVAAARGLSWRVLFDAQGQRSQFRF